MKISPFVHNYLMRNKQKTLGLPPLNNIVVEPYMVHIGCIIFVQYFECTWVGPF